MKHMPDRYFHFRQLPFKEIKIKKNVCHSYPYFFPFPMFFVSFSLSYIRFLLPEERPLNISCSTDLLTSNSPQLLFLWKSLHFSLFFERYFHRTQNSELIFFFFFSSLKGWLNCLLLALFLTVNLFWLPIFVPPENVFFLWLLWKISLYLWISAVWLLATLVGFFLVFVLLRLSEFLGSVVACLSVILKIVSSIIFLSTFLLYFWYSKYMCIASYLLDNLFSLFHYFFKAIFIHVFLAILVFFLPGTFSSCSEQGLFFVVVHRCLIFSYCGAHSLGWMVFSSCGMWAQ